jgi:hypothetical protein
MMTLRPKDWYWIVAGNDSQVYSSKRNIYVPLDDPAYIDWLTTHVIGGPIANEADIWPYVSGPPRALPQWLFDGTTFAQPAATQYTKVQLQSYQRHARWIKEQGGMTLSSGMLIKTDDRSQAKINGMRHIADTNKSSSTEWEAADGSFRHMTAQDIIAMSNQLQIHIDNCFSISSAVAADIDSGTITSLDQIDTAFDEVKTRVPEWAK